MTGLREVLESMGVMEWLQAQFPSLSDNEILGAVQDDFEGVLESLADLKALGTEAGPRATGDGAHDR